MEFAVVGLLARVQLAEGQAHGVLETVESIRRRFFKLGETRFLPNIDALPLLTACHWKKDGDVY